MNVRETPAKTIRDPNWVMGDEDPLATLQSSPTITVAAQLEVWVMYVVGVEEVDVEGLAKLHPHPLCATAFLS